MFLEFIFWEARLFYTKKILKIWKLQNLVFLDKIDRFMTLSYLRSFWGPKVSEEYAEILVKSWNKIWQSLSIRLSVKSLAEKVVELETFRYLSAA